MVKNTLFEIKAAARGVLAVFALVLGLTLVGCDPETPSIPENKDPKKVLLVGIPTGATKVEMHIVSAFQGEAEALVAAGSVLDTDIGSNEATISLLESANQVITWKGTGRYYITIKITGGSSAGWYVYTNNFELAAYGLNNWSAGNDVTLTNGLPKLSISSGTTYLQFAYFKKYHA